MVKSILSYEDLWPLIKFAARRYAKQQDQEDLISDVMLACIESELLEHYDSRRASLKTLIFAMVRNRWLGQMDLRKSERRAIWQKIVLDDLYDYDLPSMRLEVVECLNYLHSMPDPYWWKMIRDRLYGTSTKEHAAAQKVTISAVGMRLGLLRKLLIASGYFRNVRMLLWNRQSMRVKFRRRLEVQSRLIIMGRNINGIYSK
jgi:DNA-directed RNA polymerase specialized sigma24 family protein